MGGFGWAAREVARTFEDPTLGVDVVYFTGQVRGRPGQKEMVVHGRRLILKQPTLSEDARLVSAERVDLLLVIDYRPTYFNVCQALPETPIVFWMRDPR